MEPVHMLKASSVLCRHDVPADKGGLEEPKVLDELVHLVGECKHHINF